MTWDKPVINAATDLAINAYRIYWDESFRSSGDFVLYAEVQTYDQNFYTATNLAIGHLYKFQLSAVNNVGEGPLSTEI